jgi:hypothetical protein
LGVWPLLAKVNVTLSVALAWTMTRLFCGSKRIQGWLAWFGAYTPSNRSMN